MKGPVSGIATRSQIATGKSGATVVHVTREGGAQWIEKIGVAADTSVEADIMVWCAGRLPVAEVLAVEAGVLKMSVLPGINLTDASLELL